MPKLEKDLEERCRALARACDGELLKFKPPQKGWHDRLLLLPGYMALVEFKRVKKAKVQPLQNDRQAWCETRRIPAFRVWDYAQFCEIIQRNVNERTWGLAMGKRWTIGWQEPPHLKDYLKVYLK